MDVQAAPSVLRALVGPTAAGKSALALDLAERHGLELLSLDSMLVYRGMDIGTAKPSAAELARVPHHLIDLVEPRVAFSAQLYLEHAARAEAQLAARGVRGLYAGGTALYLKALVSGLFEGPAPEPQLRAQLARRVREQGADALHAELARVDPQSAARIHPRDEKRVLRALEVQLQTGRALSDWQRQWGAAERERPRRLVGLQVEGPELEARIRERTRALLESGWAREALELEQGGGLGPSARQAIGYAEALELARGTLDFEQALARIALRTRQFARRQRTWLRRFPEIRWVRAPGAGAEEHERALREVALQLEL
jgi:tRNA dimethylallyltransferase